jgi:hypothetical protein
MKSFSTEQHIHFRVYFEMRMSVGLPPAPSQLVAEKPMGAPSLQTGLPNSSAPKAYKSNSHRRGSGSESLLQVYTQRCCPTDER